LCLTVLTENLSMQLVCAKFVLDFWLKKKRIYWPFATAWSRWEELNAINYYV